MAFSTSALTSGQRAWLDSILGQWWINRDHSWNLMESRVLEVTAINTGKLIIKIVGGAQGHHLRRELAAYRLATAPLIATGHVPKMVAANEELGIFVLTHLPGVLAEGTPLAHDEEVHRQAGELLARFHQQDNVELPVIKALEYEVRQQERIARVLASEHRIDSITTSRVERVLAHHARNVGDLGRADAGGCEDSLVPTHGDWHPRNWLVTQRTVQMIDFGRFDFRPAQTDLVQLWSKQWREAPMLEQAFLDGYGSDPRTESWNIECLRQGIATAVWAYQMGDEPFEQHGHRIIAWALTECGK